MKSVGYVLCLLLSLPNLICGFAFAVLRRTFRTWNLFDIMLNFLESVVWGVPIAVLVFLLLLVTGVIHRTQRYATWSALALNIAALVLVIRGMGLPADSDQAIAFVPITIAFVGFAVIAIQDVRYRLGRDRMRNLETRNRI